MVCQGHQQQDLLCVSCQGEGRHEPLIDQETWDRAQNLKMRKMNAFFNQKTKATYADRAKKQIWADVKAGRV